MTNECENCKLNYDSNYEHVFFRYKNLDEKVDRENYYCSIACLLFALGIREGV